MHQTDLESLHQVMNMPGLTKPTRSFYDAINNKNVGGNT